jgi:DNA/RNA-binding domain of Phe-tRNA-synthetase-like protein
MINVAPHANLELVAFEAVLPGRLGGMQSPAWERELLDAAFAAPVRTSEAIRDAVRAMLRSTGFKPAGRNKPSPEYLARVASEGGVPSINPVADIGNAVGLHSGLPVSVVDPDRLTEPMSVRVADDGARYVFNASGQEIDVGRLVCLFDAAGPCACAVKDAQRAKTTPDTVRVLNLVWGCQSHPDHVAATEKWFRELLARLGATTSP